MHLSAEQVATLRKAKVAATLTDGFEISIVAGSPLVTHPIMGCVDDKGRLFVGDAVGANWNRAQLNANPPNRILMLEDTDGDGIYDKSTVYADHLTFPQGACWLNGSLYVCSPPSLWKFTDTKGNGIADQREELVTGFEYTGNAADTHGPKLHPNGRLYWCHGRKGHKVTGKDGKVVHEGLASGIWSCKPDGTDVRWDALGCADNPTGLAITPDGDLLGTCNLYYNGPRGDTLMHWLEGGVYERADQMKAIAGLPRTLEHMPIIHNFGHVAVSGCSFWNTRGNRDLFVTHFNTQRLVRMELTPSGSTYVAIENEFLKLAENDAHLTDVFEDDRGGLLLLNTGGWFRSGCPSSLIARPDVMGAIYRITSRSPLPAIDRAPYHPPVAEDVFAEDPGRRLRALAIIARDGRTNEKEKAALRIMFGAALDAPLEHALIFAAQKLGGQIVSEADLERTKNPVEIRRMLRSADPGMPARARVALANFGSSDPALAAVALGIVSEPAQQAAGLRKVEAWLGAETSTESQCKATAGLLGALLQDPAAQTLVTRMLSHQDPALRIAALTLIAGKAGTLTNETWVGANLTLLARRDNLPLRLDAIHQIKDARFDEPLRAIASDAKESLTLRLKALDAMKGLQLNGEIFTLLRTTLTDPAASAAARIKAATMIATGLPDDQQFAELGPLLTTVGPIELKELLPLIRKAKKPEMAAQLAEAIARNPAIIAIQESIFRTEFSSYPAEVLEKELLPARRAAEQLLDRRKLTMVPLAIKVAAEGRPLAGKALFEAGKGSCIICHQIGTVGRSIGPNLTHIGGIRVERDLVESVLFPSNTLARDYETHVVETTDGQSIMGVIRSHTAEGLLIVDAGGQEHHVANATVVADTVLPTSLMPMGLDQTLSAPEFLDLIAYLRSLH